MGKEKVTRALKTGFNSLKRLAKNYTGKQVTRKVAGEAMKYAPLFYEKGVSRVKNRSVRNALNSNFANTTLNCGTAYAQDRLNGY